MSSVPTMEDYRRELKNRETHVKESWVKAMEARLVREELQKCYRGEGVNHLQNCKELADLYTRMIRENKIKGYAVVDSE